MPGRFRFTFAWRQRRLQILLTTFVVTACAVLWLGIVLHARQRESAALTHAHRDVANLSIALREEIDRTLTSVDQVLRFIVADYHDDPLSFDFQAWVRRADTIQPSTVQIGIANALGEFTMSSLALPTGGPVVVGDREYFQVHVQRPDTGVFVGQSVSLHVRKSWGFQISRRLETPDGRFAGVVFATINPDRLAERFAAIDIGDGGSLTLIGTDGYVRVRAPAFDGMYGRDIRQSPAGRALLANLSSRPDGTARVASALDGSERIFGYRTVGSFPLAIVVGKSVSGILNPLAEEWRRLATFGFSANALFGALLVFSTRELNRRRRSERELVVTHASLATAERSTREANRLLRLGEEIAQVGHWRIALPEASISWSDGLFRILGLDPVATVPTLAFAIGCCHPDDREQVVQCMGQAIENATPFTFALRIVNSDGLVREVAGRGLCELSETGQVTALFGTLLDVTELRRLERSAGETLALLAATLESMDQGLIVVSPAGDIALHNPRAAELLGLPADMLASRPTADAVLAHQWAAGEFAGCAAEVQAFMQPHRGVASPQSYARTRPNGTALEIRTMPMPGGGIVRTYTDVSAKRDVEVALRESEFLYRLLAETTTDVITRLNLDFKREYVSPSCRGLFGLEPDEMLGRQPSGAMHPDDALAVRELAQRLVSGAISEEHAIVTYRARHRLGHWVWVEAAMRLACDEAGAPQSIVCSLRDVSKRKLAEQALEESESRYRLLAENATDVIARLTLDTTLTFLSPSITAIAGYEGASLVGKQSREITHPDDIDRVERMFRELAAAGPGAKAARTEYRIRHKAGHWIWIEINPSCLFDESGQPTGFIDVIRDVTARKTTEKALGLARAEAERAKSEAEAASLAKTEFLASMSHEVRTPLNGILGYTEALLDDSALYGEQRRYVKNIQTAGSALLTVVNDVLDFSKIEAGQIDLDPRPYALTELMNGAVEIVRGLAEAKRLELSVGIHEAVPEWIIGDPDRLRQVVLNLLNNAIKFTPTGSVKLLVGLGGAETPPGSIHIEVVDTGIGIAPNRRSLLFRRFSQIDGSFRRKHGGTGLGLAISKNLIELMGGVIDFESQPLQGSRFWFTVPLAPAEKPSGEPVISRATHAAEGSSVLLVDDMDFNQELVRLILEKSGYQVDVVSDGVEAVMAVQVKDYDVVLMDVQMPGMDGVTATRLIRAMSEPRCLVPVIAMTANVLPSQLAEFDSAGMTDHIGKPFKRDELCAIVERWVGRKHSKLAKAA